MPLSIHSDVPPLRQTDDGVVRIADSRIPLERVVRAFLAGMTPEQIAQNFDVLKIEDIYAVVNYYLHHREEVDAYLLASEDEANRIRMEIERQIDPTGIRNVAMRGKPLARLPDLPFAAQRRRGRI